MLLQDGEGFIFPLSPLGRARLNDLIEQVVVGCGVGEECLAAGDGEGEDVQEGVDGVMDGGKGGEFGGVGCQEAEEGEEGAPEVGPVVWEAGAGPGEVG